jgi:Flp pilus assembly protein TadG
VKILGLLHFLEKRSKKHSRGQGLIETAILFPVLLIVLSGLVEFGFLLNEYMAIQDAARNAARFAADLDYRSSDTNQSCASDASGTRDFYRQITCLVKKELAQERPEIILDVKNGHDDVIVSAFSIASDTTTVTSTVAARFPNNLGWSMALDTPGYNHRNQNTQLTTSDVDQKLYGTAPSTGFVSVEIFYDYHQKLRLPWITAFMSDPLLLHGYALMPLVSAEPTPTALP